VADSDVNDRPDPVTSIVGPVQAEVFVLRLSQGGIPELAGPCGPALKGLLSDSWRAALAGYVPESFQHLG
jgi:hypothetical protein